MPESHAASVICFGEILWDFLPDGLFPGGAPFNVAYHLHQLGAGVRVVSSVGADLLGEELLRRLRGWDIPTDLIARSPDRPTGYVRATISAGGDASYEITSDVAWDQIAFTDEAKRAAQGARAAVFGSLAQRSIENRASLERILDALPADALRVFDVNLRPPHDDLELVRALAARSSVLKLNAAEAARLACGEEESPGREKAHAQLLSAQTRTPVICITAGARGAGLLRNGTWSWEPGQPVQVEDTVGAGDAFLACLVTLLIRENLSDQEILARACRLGEWVASRRGATPAHPSPRTPTGV